MKQCLLLNVETKCLNILNHVLNKSLISVRLIVTDCKFDLDYFNVLHRLALKNIDIGFG